MAYHQIRKYKTASVTRKDVVTTELLCLAEAEVLSSVQILKLKFGQDFEAEVFGRDFVVKDWPTF